MGWQMATTDPSLSCSRPSHTAGIQTYVVATVADLFNVVLAKSLIFGNESLWWRGQAKEDWGVVPSIHHKGKAKWEAAMAVRFRNRAGVRHAAAAALGDGAAGWLFLMQHYGLPTRLLDWSESPLVGLFFAVREEQYHGSNGALWAIAPSRLNKCQTGDSMIFGTGAASTLFNEAFNIDQTATTGQTLAIIAPHNDLRQMVQASEFTIHGSPQPLNEHPNAGDFLIRINIPSVAKAGLKQSLTLLQVCEASLFPDLEHLAREIGNLAFADR